MYWYELLCIDVVHFCILMSINVHWHAGMMWFEVSCNDVHFCVLICNVTYRSTLLCTDVYDCVLCCCALYWHHSCVLMCTTVSALRIDVYSFYWCTRLYTDVHWCVLIGDVLLLYVDVHPRALTCIIVIDMFCHVLTLLLWLVCIINWCVMLYIIQLRIDPIQKQQNTKDKLKKTRSKNNQTTTNKTQQNTNKQQNKNKSKSSNITKQSKVHTKHNTTNKNNTNTTSKHET